MPFFISSCYLLFFLTGGKNEGWKWRLNWEHLLCFSHHTDMHEYVVFELNNLYGSDHRIEDKIVCFSACTLRHIILASHQCSLVSSFYNMTDK